MAHCRSGVGTLSQFEMLSHGSDGSGSATCSLTIPGASSNRTSAAARAPSFASGTGSYVSLKRRSLAALSSLRIFALRQFEQGGAVARVLVEPFLDVGLLPSRQADVKECINSCLRRPVRLPARSEPGFKFVMRDDDSCH